MGRTKKIIVSVIVILLLSAGGFLCWKNQEDVKSLNSGLPEGIKVVKTLTGKYRVINEIDGYEFKIPDSWEKIEKIYYAAEETIQGYVASSLSLRGLSETSKTFTVDHFKITNPEKINLESWAKNNFETFGLIGVFKKEKVGEFEIVKTQEFSQLSGMHIYFLKKDLAIYVMLGASETLIQDIIINGKW